MKSQHYLKPNQAKDAIIIGVVLLILVIVTVFLFQYPIKNKKGEVKSVFRPKEKSQKQFYQQSFSDNSENIKSSHGINEDEVFRRTYGKKSCQYNLNRGLSDKSPALRLQVSPPIPFYDVQPIMKQINANVGASFITLTNSQIIIPPNAFIDECGNVAEGNVEFQYREFHDFADIFLSGIPMKYDSAGNDGMLESAGMIELLASKDNKLLYVNPSSQIKIMLASASKSVNYNLYFFDKKEQRWVYKGKDKVLSGGLGDIQSDLNDVSANSRDMLFRYNGFNYKVAMQCWSDMRDQRKYFFSKKKVPAVLDFRFIYDKESARELKSLRGITWRYEGTDAREIYSKIFSSAQYKYSEIITTSYKGLATINETANEFRLKIVRDSFTLEIPIHPVIRSEIESRSFGTKWNRYLTLKEQRMKSEDEALEAFIKDTTEYHTRFGKSGREVVSAQTVALRLFQVDGFGIWNCDHPYTPPIANNVYARFVDEKGQPLAFSTGYMVEKEKNSVYTLTDFQHFRFNPEGSILFWAVLPGNKIAIVNPAEFARHQYDKSGTCTFIAKISDTALRSYANLRSELSFN